MNRRSFLGMLAGGVAAAAKSEAAPTTVSRPSSATKDLDQYEDAIRMHCQLQEMKAMLRAGLMTPNEVRRREGLEVES